MASDDGTGWDIASPRNDDVVSDGATEIRDVRAGVGVRINKEHETLAADSVGGEHKQGSAKVYSSDTEPLLQPEGGSALLVDADEGRLWVKSSSNVLKWYTGAQEGEGWKSLVPDPASLDIITGSMIVNGTIHSGKLAGLHDGITSQGVEGKLTADVDDETIDFNNAGGGGGNQLRVKPGSIGTTQLAADAQPRDYILITEEESAGVNATAVGGGVDSGYMATGELAMGWVQRKLNSKKVDTLDDAGTLNDNTIVIPSGRWIIKARVPGYSIGHHIAQVVNEDDDEVLLEGSSAASDTDTNSGNQTDSNIIGELNLSSETTIRIEHRGTSNNGTSGLGGAVNVGNAKETYTVVELLKIGVYVE